MKNKYNLDGIKRAGEICTKSEYGNLTCCVLSETGFGKEHYLHVNIFDIPCGDPFDDMIYTLEGYFPENAEMKELRLMALAMTHEIARRMNKGENILGLTSK